MRRALAFALLVPALASAQTRTTWSAYMGATSARLGPFTGSDDVFRGFTAGLTWTVPVNSYVALEGGASWVQKGGRVYSNTLGPRDVTLEYMETPFSVRLSDRLDGGHVRPFVRLGFSIAGESRCYERKDQLIFAQSADVGILVTNSVVVRARDACGNARQQKIDFGPIGGLGLILRKGTSQYLLELRQSEGRDLGATNATTRIRTSTTTLLLGIGW